MKTEMIVRLWTTRVDKSRIAEYEENEQNRSTPTFRDARPSEVFLREPKVKV